MIGLMLITCLPAQSDTTTVHLPESTNLIHVGMTVKEIHQLLGQPQFVSRGKTHFEVWPGDLTVFIIDGKAALIKTSQTTTETSTETETATVLMPVLFSADVTVVINLVNRSTAPKPVLIQTFASNGTLVDSIVRTAALGNTEVRVAALPISAPTNEVEFPFVANISPGTPAEKVGLRAGDLLLKADAHRLTRIEELRPIIQNAGGKSVAIVYERNDVRYEVEVTPICDTATALILPRSEYHAAQCDPANPYWRIGLLVSTDLV